MYSHGPAIWPSLFWIPQRWNLGWSTFVFLFSSLFNKHKQEIYCFWHKFFFHRKACFFSMYSHGPAIWPSLFWISQRWNLRWLTPVLFTRILTITHKKWYIHSSLLLFSVQLNEHWHHHSSKNRKIILVMKWVW